MLHYPKDHFTHFLDASLSCVTDFNNVAVSDLGSWIAAASWIAYHHYQLTTWILLS